MREAYLLEFVPRLRFNGNFMQTAGLSDCVGAIVGARTVGERVGRGQGSEAEKARYVRGMFDAIAPRYDLTNTLISASLHGRWKRKTAALVQVPQGGRALDICCGTGDLALLLADLVGPRGHVIGIDISERMLAVARQKAAAAELGSRVDFALGDAEALAIRDASFDGATVGFGIRNTVHPDATLRELYRVLRPGARLVVLEFSTPRNPIVRRLYDWYSLKVIPWLGRLASRHADAYLYLTTSTRAWPDQEAFAATMARAGFEQVRYHDLLTGISAIHVGVRPARAG